MEQPIPLWYYPQFKCIKFMGTNYCVHPHDKRRQKKNRYRPLGQNSIFQGHALQTPTTLFLVTAVMKITATDLSLVSSKGAVTVTTVSPGETEQRSTSYLFNSFCPSAKQQTLAKGLYWCQLPPLLIWFLTSSPGPAAVSHWCVQAVCLDIWLWRQRDFFLQVFVCLLILAKCTAGVRDFSEPLL